MGDGGPIDPRWKWISDRVVPLLKSKAEFFDKLVQTEEGETILKDFCTNESTMKLFFAAAAKEMFVWTELPSNHKKKCVYVLKKSECTLDEKKVDDIFDQVVVGDLNKELLENMHTTLNKVYLPIISNARNTTVRRRRRCAQRRARRARPPAARPPRRAESLPGRASAGWSCAPSVPRPPPASPARVPMRRRRPPCGDTPTWDDAGGAALLPCGRRRWRRGGAPMAGE